jgi:pimeloyl-ACP methyl ester carboxylesterase
MTEADAFVLIHSAHHGSWVWERRAPYLSLPIVTVDLPGRNGQARGTDVTSVARCAARVAEQIEHAGIRRAVLVGHSLAGGVAYTVAADHPATVAHLNTLAPQAAGGRERCDSTRSNDNNVIHIAAGLRGPFRSADNMGGWRVGLYAGLCAPESVICADSTDMRSDLRFKRQT